MQPPCAPGLGRGMMILGARGASSGVSGDTPAQYPYIECQQKTYCTANCSCHDPRVTPCNRSAHSKRATAASEVRTRRLATTLPSASGRVTGTSGPACGEENLPAQTQQLRLWAYAFLEPPTHALLRSSPHIMLDADSVSRPMTAAWMQGGTTVACILWTRDGCYRWR